MTPAPFDVGDWAMLMRRNLYGGLIPEGAGRVQGMLIRGDEVEHYIVSMLDGRILKWRPDLMERCADQTVVEAPCDTESPEPPRAT